MTTEATLLLRGAREVLTLDRALVRFDPKGTWSPEALGLIENGSVAVSGDRIIAVGSTAEVDRAINLARGATVIDVGDRVLCPGLVDSHTHSLFVGARADEFSARVRGDDYRAIAARGGGIARSVAALRSANQQTLVDALTSRLDRMERSGTTTVEVKTGYGLSPESELLSLEVIARMGERVVPTFLAFHAVSPELRSVARGRETFVKEVSTRTLPRVLSQGIARYIDAYIDGPGFTVDECLSTLRAARNAGLGVRLHVGQFEDVGGAELAVALGAASADHLETVTDNAVRALAQAGVVGVLLPGAAFSLRQTPPDARRLRAMGLSIALGTDCNPGTSHTESLPLMAAFAVRQQGLTTVEAWHAITRVAADSLGLSDRGRLIVGARADLAVFDYASWEALPYDFGTERARLVVRAGRVTHQPRSWEIY